MFELIGFVVVLSWLIILSGCCVIAIYYGLTTNDKDAKVTGVISLIVSLAGWYWMFKKLGFL